MTRLSDADLIRLAEQLEDAKAERDAWDSEVQRVQSLLLDNMAEGEKRRVLDGDTFINVTPVHGSRVVTDPNRLRSKLTPQQWRTVTSLVLDTRKLEAAITSGLINPLTVAAASTEVPIKPYVKLTRTKSRKPRRRGA